MATRCGPGYEPARRIDSLDTGACVKARRDPRTITEFQGHVSENELHIETNYIDPSKIRAPKRKPYCHDTKCTDICSCIPRPRTRKEEIGRWGSIALYLLWVLGSIVMLDRYDMDPLLWLLVGFSFALGLRKITNGDNA